MEIAHSQLEYELKTQNIQFDHFNQRLLYARLSRFQLHRGQATIEISHKHLLNKDP